MQKLQTRRAVDLAAEAVRDAILDGRFAAGAFLPPERELAVTLGINRLTLRAAIAHLEAEGLLRAWHGEGVRVLDWRTSGGVALLSRLLERGDRRLLRPFLELRRALGAEAVALACERATDGDLDALDAIAARLANERDPDALAAGNLDFARRVVQLADNLPMELLFNTVARVYAARPELRADLMTEPDAVRASFPAIAALLRTRDPASARARVREVLAAIDTITLSRLEPS
jgi:GntR family transcriptional repressor for pyruvate dehydrogenase complex